MAGDLMLKASKGDFERFISQIETKMDALRDVVRQYERARTNLDQFMEDGDSNYELMIERIDLNIEAAEKSYAALQETKSSLQDTVDKMENMGGKVGETIQSAIGAVGSVINTAIKVDGVL